LVKADGTARHAADEALTKWPAASGYDYDKLKLDPNWEQDESQAVHLLMKPGQFFLFISRCMHGSEPNTSKSSTHYGWSTRFVTTDGYMQMVGILFITSGKIYP